MASLASKNSSISSRVSLREATHEIHERLHTHPAFLNLLNQTIGRDQYRTLLARLYGFHNALEVALLPLGGPLGETAVLPQKRAHRLADDLKFLGLSDSGIAALPLSAVPDSLDRRGGYLGCLYVREGATLGGRVIAAKLNHLFGAETQGRRFFSGDTSDTLVWRTCCVALERPAPPTELDEMIAAAQQTFQIFETWMSELIHEKRALTG